MKPTSPMFGFGPTFPKPAERPDRGPPSQRRPMPQAVSEPTVHTHFGPSMVRQWAATGVEGVLEVVTLPQGLGRLTLRWRELRGPLAVGKVGGFELEGRTLSHSEALLDVTVNDAGSETRHYRESGLVEVCVTELCWAVQRGGVVKAHAEADGSFVFAVVESSTGVADGAVIASSESVEGRLDATGSHVSLLRRSYVDTSS